MIDVLDCSIVPEVAPKKRGGGPKTPEGKKRAKANSMKHGLRAKVLLPEELVAAFDEHKAELARHFLPRSRYEDWLVGEMALAMARLDRCADLAVADLRRCLDVAAFDWDDDRRAHVEALGKRLAADPSRVAHALERSRHGADWMVERWEGLRAVLEAVGSCDEGLRRLACDLMGVPPELRAGGYKVPPAADLAGLSALAEREIARLRGRRERVLDDRDEARRSMAMAGMPLDEDPGTARLRRYEAGIRRALGWAHAELRRVREGAAPGREPEWAGGDDSLVRSEPISGAGLEYQVARTVRPDPVPPEEEAAPVAEDEAPGPRTVVAVAVAVEAAPGAKRPSAMVPVIAKSVGVSPSPACTAAHRGAGPRNRFERRAAKSQARKAERCAAEG
jgi:hypothetical protein